MTIHDQSLSHRGPACRHVYNGREQALFNGRDLYVLSFQLGALAAVLSKSDVYSVANTSKQNSYYSTILPCLHLTKLRHVALLSLLQCRLSIPLDGSSRQRQGPQHLWHLRLDPSESSMLRGWTAPSKSILGGSDSEGKLS